jgi:hypothetical protein
MRATDLKFLVGPLVIGGMVAGAILLNGWLDRKQERCLAAWKILDREHITLLAYEGTEKGDMDRRVGIAIDAMRLMGADEWECKAGLREIYLERWPSTETKQNP